MGMANGKIQPYTRTRSARIGETERCSRAYNRHPACAARTGDEHMSLHQRRRPSLEVVALLQRRASALVERHMLITRTSSAGRMPVLTTATALRLSDTRQGDRVLV